MAKLVRNHSHFNPKTTISLTFQVGRVYYISAPEIIKIEEPHYFIVVAKCEDDGGYLLMSTTQIETITKHFKSIGRTEETIATLAPNPTNGLTKYSYLDCNQLHHVKAVYLESKLKEEKLESRGCLTRDEYLSIKSKIEKSEIVETVIKKMLLDDYNN